LLDDWWSPGVAVDDLHLSEGYVAARRSRQLEMLSAAGVEHAAALAILYETHPTSNVAPETIETETIEMDGFVVRDGMFVRIEERGEAWLIQDGFGHIGPDGRLVVDAATGVSERFPSKRAAAEAACSLLKERVSELRERFFEKRSFFRFVPGKLFETPMGTMDMVEVISPDIARAFMSGSSDAGCYVLAEKAADALPAFAIFEREQTDRRGFLDAEGMGLIVPILFPKVFSAEERLRAERALAADHPLTYAVLAGGMLDRSNMSAVMMEWDDDHEPEDFPEYMVVEELKSTGKSVIVMGVLTDDVLNRRDVADGHLFQMPAEDFHRNLPIDPRKHKMLHSKNMAIKIVRPR
jgi:hypothetical protein